MESSIVCQACGLRPAKPQALKPLTPTCKARLQPVEDVLYVLRELGDVGHTTWTSLLLTPDETQTCCMHIRLPGLGLSPLEPQAPTPYTPTCKAGFDRAQ